MIKHNDKGFGLIGIVAIVAVIAAAVIGVFLFQSNNDDTESANTQESAQQEQVNTISDVEQTEESEANESEEEASTAGITITTGDSAFGEMLFDSNNQAIYIFELDTTPESVCYDDCARAWPPVLTDGAPQADGNTDASLLGTTERTDGTTQVTYNGKPLYYYVDEGPGQVLCHNVSTHGGLWWVIQPNGERAI